MQFEKMEVAHYALDEGVNRDNLKTLADYLINLPVDYKHFEMRYFFSTERNSAIMPYQNRFVERINECGTVACAAGHGPLAGLKEEPTDETWTRYINRVFGVPSINRGIGEFLFSGEWSCQDNSPQGAAKRIYYALQHGVPFADEWDAFDRHERILIAMHLNA